MKNFFMSLCSVLVAYGTAGFIKNSGKTAKITRFVFALSVLCSLISIIPDVNIDSVSFSSFEKADYTNASLSVAAFEETVENMLQKEELEFESVEAFSSKNTDGSINIEKIRVKGVEDGNKVKKFLEQNTGVEQIEVSEDK